MKKILFGFSTIMLSLSLAGCGKSSNNFINKDTIKEHNIDNNALECKVQDTDLEISIYAYFDKNDAPTSFDYYIITPKGNTTEEKVKVAEEKACGGEGDFEKEWIKECSYVINGNDLNGHIYVVDNGEWFKNKSKEEIINNSEEEFFGLKCSELK